MSDKLSITFLCGLPASGKSTYAQELVEKNNGNIVRVNKDDIRAMFSAHRDDMAFDKNREHVVVEMERQAARSLLEHGFNVIVDDTNFSSKHENFFKQLAEELNCDFHKVDFTHVSVENCITRDKNRDNSVGEEVIYKMASNAGLVESENQPINLDQPYLIVDVDGTIADATHRLGFIKNLHNDPNWKKDWQAFFEESKFDTPNERVIHFIKGRYPDAPIVFMTGCPESYKHSRRNWLNMICSKYGLTYEGILMRPIGDRRSDDTVKEELLLNYLQPGKVLLAIDDSSPVLDMFKNNGIEAIHPKEIWKGKTVLSKKFFSDTLKG